jgi:Ca2+-binding EF-hand superfamily protein
MIISSLDMAPKGTTMSTTEGHDQSMAACGGCSAIIPLDSTTCPTCGIRLGGEQQRWECGACGELFDHEPRSCRSCGVVFVADDVVHVLRTWLDENSMTVVELFGRFDTNGDGVIDSRELKEGLLALNLAALPPDQVDLLVTAIDENGDGSIDLNELQLTLSADEAPSSESDTTDESSLEYSENVLERVMERFGIPISERASFLEHAASFNDDANAYLKEQELIAAATSWVEQVSSDEESQDASPMDDVDPQQATVNDESEVQDDGDAEEESDDVGLAEEDEPEDVPEASDEDERAKDEDQADVDDDTIQAEDDDVNELSDDGSGVDTDDPFGALLDALEDMDITQMFHEVDTDGSGYITIDELYQAIVSFTGLKFSIDQVEAIARTIDGDSDGTIDRMEFVAAVEAHDGVVEPVVIPEKPFPSAMQKRMMSKRWNDIVWPLIHASFGMLLVLLLVNALLGPVDGSGGAVAFEPSADHVLKFGEGWEDADGKSILPGDIYPCDKAVQEGKCANSLTPFAGDADSMPAGFYWDGILGMVIAIGGMVTSLFTHYVVVPGWRARARAMKELELDHEDASSEIVEEASDEVAYDEDENDEDEHDEEEYDEEEYDEEEYDEEEYDEEVQDGDGVGVEDDADDGGIDVGSHVGVVIDGEDYFGTIVEFNDDEGTVTIEEDGTGDLIEADQDSMFLE